jgi:D-alanine-D-alanine ligase
MRGENKLKVAVLMGGIGEERDISIQSGQCVAQALKEAGLNVITADIQPDNMAVLDESDIDVFFIALHGRFGEDGRLQQILEEKGLVYTGSGPAASRLAFDKMASKKDFAKAGVAVPAAFKFNSHSDTEHLEKKFRQLVHHTSGGLVEKYVIKPIRQGSTIGVTIANDPKSAIIDARKCLTEFGDCMIEEYIPGREFTVGILENQALPIIEIRTKSGFYDYHAKYIDEGTEYLFDTINDSALIEKINQAAIVCFNALGCRHFARVDFILGNDTKPYVLEVNTIPGFTTHSLLPKAAAKTGLSMSNLCIKIIEAALVSRRRNGNAKIFSPSTCPERGLR